MRLILETLRYDKEGKLAGPTQILPGRVRSPALILKTASWFNSGLLWIVPLDGNKCQWWHHNGDVVPQSPPLMLRYDQYSALHISRQFLNTWKTPFRARYGWIPNCHQSFTFKVVVLCAISCYIVPRYISRVCSTLYHHAYIMILSGVKGWLGI